MQTGVSRRGAEIRRGATAMIPLLLGVAPFAMVFAVSSVAAGLDLLQTMAMSLIVFAGSAQFTGVNLIAAGAAPWSIIITTLILNARHLLMASALAANVPRLGFWGRLGLGIQLTDESYAVGAAAFLRGAGSPAFQFGANMSLYIVWAGFTLIGALIGSAIPDPAALGLDLIFPLTFLAMLVPLLRERASRWVALAAALLTVGAALLLPGSWYVLVAGLGASLIGMRLPRGTT
jgi:4-azaleucine resistance transporter AzlC